MILPKALVLGVQLIMPIAAGDGVPQPDREPVCKGIAEQGGVTFQDPRVEQEKKNCIESEQTIREQVVKQWSSFSADDRTHCVNETTMGRWRPRANREGNDMIEQHPTFFSVVIFD